MSDPTKVGTGYYCPMHTDIHQPLPGKCSKCGMDLVPYGTRFALLHHMLGKPAHIVVMAALMLAVMAAAMMMLR